VAIRCFVLDSWGTRQKEKESHGDLFMSPGSLEESSHMTIIPQNAAVGESRDHRVEIMERQVAPASVTASGTRSDCKAVF
jgi:hypothetical protein